VKVISASIYALGRRQARRRACARAYCIGTIRQQRPPISNRRGRSKPTKILRQSGEKVAPKMVIGRIKDHTGSFVASLRPLPPILDGSLRGPTTFCIKVFSSEQVLLEGWSALERSTVRILVMDDYAPWSHLVHSTNAVAPSQPRLRLSNVVRTSAMLFLECNYRNFKFARHVSSVVDAG
jgi:hypothetical protein